MQTTAHKWPQPEWRNNVNRIESNFLSAEPPSSTREDSVESVESKIDLVWAEMIHNTKVYLFT